jgi:hypothetical protein
MKLTGFGRDSAKIEVKEGLILFQQLPVNIQRPLQRI